MQPIYRRRALGIGLIEMMALVAFLAIALGLAVSVARHVRSTSAQEATRARLSTLVAVARLYAHDFGGQLPSTDLPESTQLDEKSVRSWSRRQNLRVLEAFLLWQGGEGAGGSGTSDESEKGSVGPLPLPGPRVDASLLVDTWGSPIALVSRSHTQIGLSPGNGPFFFSAGPDRDYLTLSDNLYSYEVTGLLPAVAPP